MILAIISRRMRWKSHVARVEERKVAYTVSAESPEGKKKFVRPRRRWENNIKIYIQDVG